MFVRLPQSCKRLRKRGRERTQRIVPCQGLSVVELLPGASDALTFGAMPIDTDILTEGRRIVDASRKADLPLRLIGGVAIRLHTQRAIPAPLARSYGDVDLVTAPRAAKRTIALMVDLGYESNERFNAMNGHERLVFYDVANARQVDVFVGEFRMCHRLPIAERLNIDPWTVPLAELLLTKLQIARLNEKDTQDIYTLLLEHPVGQGDDETINATYIAALLSGDWGLWRTSTETIEIAATRLDAIGLEPEHRDVIHARIDQLKSAIDTSPKPLKWRSRARVGDRLRWYEEPEEIGHHGGSPRSD